MSSRAVEKILDETDLEEDDLQDEVQEKMEEFSGLVSEEGAVHLVAKEHGVELAEAQDQDLKLENVVPEMRNVNIKARVVNIMDANTFTRDDGDEGKVQNVVIGDDTGTLRVTLWDEQTKIASQVEEGDPIQISGAYTVEDDRGNAEIRLGDDSQVKMADEDEVPEVESQGGQEASEVDIREVRSENARYLIQGMLMDVYTSNPFYHTCPECSNSVREEDSEYVCTDHGEVEPEKKLAVSGVLDDGTGNIRVVFFRDLAQEMLEVEEGPSKKQVEESASNAIGKELEIEGRTRYNDYFGRLEIIADSMNQVEPGQEIEKLMEIMEA